MAITPLKLTYEEFSQLPESTLPHELIDGELRMPAAPNLRHQEIGGNLYASLRLHVRERRLGRLWMAPIDVVLDITRPLVLQPDLVFVVHDRLPIAREKIYGAPDLVIEISSASGALFDRTEKSALYAQYGVREYWLVDPDAETAEVRRLEPAGFETVGIFRRSETIRSLVLPDLHLTVDEIFAQ
jgi:Uma2 family endonuclease